MCTTVVYSLASSWIACKKSRVSKNGEGYNTEGWSWCQSTSQNFPKSFLSFIPPTGAQPYAMLHYASFYFICRYLNPSISFLDQESMVISLAWISVLRRNTLLRTHLLDL